MCTFEKTGSDHFFKAPKQLALRSGYRVQVEWLSHKEGLARYFGVLKLF